jgi:hypothetical protein
MKGVPARIEGAHLDMDLEINCMGTRFAFGQLLRYCQFDPAGIENPP